jgi:glutathione peroxidase
MKLQPPLSFYSLRSIQNDGKTFDFETLRGKHVLIVNTASECGYTGQYAELEALYQTHQPNLVVLGFPSNDFGGQEPADDEAIAQFCQTHFGVSFPLMTKAGVKGGAAQPVYQWLCSPALNGWNSQAPGWNFCKYLVSPTGELMHFFSQAVSPMDSTITKELL